MDIFITSILIISAIVIVAICLAAFARLMEDRVLVLIDKLEGHERLRAYIQHVDPDLDERLDPMILHTAYDTLASRLGVTLTTDMLQDDAADALYYAAIRRYSSK